MKNPKTTILKEYPLQYNPEKEGDPYYPIANPVNAETYGRYTAALKPFENIHLCGRLAEYKYYNMDAVIESALDCAARVKAGEQASDAARKKGDLAPANTPPPALSVAFLFAEARRHARERSWVVFRASPSYWAARQVFLYGVIGGFCATLDFCLYFVLSRMLDWDACFAAFLAGWGLSPQGGTGWFPAFAELLHKTHWDIYFPNFISINLGIFTSFLLNAIFNFKRTDDFFKRAAKFFAVGYCGLALSMVLLRLGVVVCGYNDWAVKIFSVFFVAALQFVANKFLTFKESKQ
jgi:putative flippase GtrA